jgi:hypothetical protein
MAYRHSTDGQTPVLWLFVVIYGVLAIAAIRLLASAARRLRNRAPRT